MFYDNRKRVIVFEEKDTIVDSDGNKYIVKKQLKGGAQNAGVYVVERNDKRMMVFKLLINCEERGTNSKKELGMIKYRNVSVEQMKDEFKTTKERLEKEDEHGRFVMVDSIYSRDFSSADFPAISDKIMVKGYFMDFVKGENILKANYGKEFIDVVPSLLNLCAVFRRLQNTGYNFKDLSAGNIIYDSQTEKVFIIDCDNIQKNICGPHANSIDLKAKGTGWAIAPEIVLQDADQSANTDSFSLAFVLFYILVSTYRRSSVENGKTVYSYESEHMYEGAVFRKSTPIGYPNLLDYMTCAKEEDHVDHPEKNLIFVFDPDNDTNRWDPKYDAQAYYIHQWEKLPDEIKGMFIRAFKDPCEKKRPSASNWETTFKKMVKTKQETVPKTTIGQPTTQTLGPRLIVGTRRMDINEDGITIHWNDVGGTRADPICEIKLDGDEVVITNLSDMVLTVNNNQLRKGDSCRVNKETTIINPLMPKIDIRM